MRNRSVEWGDARVMAQDSHGRLTLSIPVRIKRRGNRKLLAVLDKEGLVIPQQKEIGAVTPLQRGLVRGYRWRAMLEEGGGLMLKEIAAREGVDRSYMSRMINLTFLAPDIIAAILDDTVPNSVTVMDLAVDPAALWEQQREWLQAGR